VKCGWTCTQLITVFRLHVYSSLRHAPSNLSLGGDLYIQMEIARRQSSMIVAGSSFDEHLEKFQRGKDMCIRGKIVKLLGLRGKCVRHTRCSLLHSPDAPCRVVVLVCGSNDMCHRTSSLVVRDLISMAEELVSRSTKHVIICQLLWRQSTSHFQKGMTLAECNARVDQTNLSLEEYIEKPATPGIQFWRHHHSVLGYRRLARDGVHMN